MNRLVTDRINEHSPYDVEYDDDLLVFTTEHGLTYAVDFDDDANPYFTAYWLNLRNVYGQVSPSDKKVAQTLICIIEEFFRQNADVLLYICSSADGHLAQRARLFMRWFNGAEQQKLYVSRTVEVKGEDKTEYVALLAQRNRPDIEKILARFDAETAMFNAMKP
jgi:hypothetical protein